jgi:DNA-binding transcriptional MerR regulator
VKYGVGIGEAAHRSGLKTKQIVYIDERGYLGPVARERNLRAFSELQVRRLERIAALRLMGLRLDEAGPLAAEDGVPSPADLARLCVVAAAKASEIERDIQAWTYVFSRIRAVLEQTNSTDAA